MTKPAYILFSIAWAATAVHIVLKYFHGPLIFGLWSSFIFAVIAAAVFSFGHWLIEKSGITETDTGLRSALAVTLGLAALAYSTLLLGLLHLFYPAAAAILIGLFLWTGRKHLYEISLLKTLIPETSADKFLLLPAALLLLITFVICWMPPHQYDSLVYHLALPQIYADKHTIAGVPENMYSHFPQNGEMLFTLSLLLNSDAVAQMMSWLATAVSCLWIYSWARKNTVSGPVSVLIALTHTAVLLLSSITYVETIVMLWVTAAVISFLQWKNEVEESLALKWIIFCGIFCGAGLGTKYYAGITAAILFAMGAYHTFSLGWFSVKRIRALHVIIFTCVCTALFAPWCIKNIAEIGNPVFPFFYRIFNSTGSGLGVEDARGYFQILTEYGYQGRFLKELFDFPYLALTSPERFGGGMDVLGSLGWELVLLGIPLMLLSAIKKPAMRWVAAYVLLHWFAWFCTGRVLRFLVVIIPLCSVLIADGFESVCREKYRMVKALLIAGLFIFAAARIAEFAYVQNVFGTPRVLLGIESRREFLSRMLVYYPCANAARKFNAGKTLLAGEQRSYYAPADRVQTSIFKMNDFVTWANTAKTPQELKAKIASAGFTNIVYTPAEMRRLRYYGTLKYTDAGRRNWDEMLKLLEPVGQAQACGLYRVQ